MRFTWIHRKQRPNMPRYLVCLVLGLIGLGSAQAQQRMYQPEQLPLSAWTVLEATPGIQIGGAADVEPSVHVIFDANCPHCAELYQSLKHSYPDLVIRWVPVAYFKDNSERMAAAILASSNPPASLVRNFVDYDFTRRRGGFRAPPYHQFTLQQAHRVLQQHWLKWGGYTPMVIVKTENAQVLKATGASEAFLAPALGQAWAHPNTWKEL